MAARAAAEPPVPRNAWTNLTVLIHGYNNDAPTAAASYDEFLTNMPLDTLARAGDIIEFYWPGDKWNFVGYSISVRRAVRSGRRLQEFLAEQFPLAPVSLTVVAHSLGCRVALEFVAAALAAQRPRFASLNLCLMAAAVPVEMLRVSGPLNGAAAAATQARILHSSCDEALGWPFISGQFGAREPTREAVGRAGGPAFCWRTPRNMTPYQHGEYWTHDESAAEVRMLFGLPTRPYVLPTRPVRRVMRLLPLPIGRRLPRRTLPGL